MNRLACSDQVLPPHALPPQGIATAARELAHPARAHSLRNGPGMRRAFGAIGSSGLLLACLLLAACNSPGFPLNASGGIGGGIGNADPATRAACTQDAERIYNVRNRAEIYAPNSSMNAPFSANYGAGSTDRGLSDQYARDAMIRDCVRNNGTEANRAMPRAPGTGTAVRP